MVNIREILSMYDLFKYFNARSGFFHTVVTSDGSIIDEPNQGPSCKLELPDVRFFKNLNFKL